MKYRPEEFHGLSDAQIAEMKALGFSRAEYDRRLRAMAYGHCCQAILHLTLASEWLQTHHPAVGRRVAKLVNVLDALLIKPAKPARPALTA